MQMYLVGGAVRDMLMGRPAKDLDYVVVLEDCDQTDDPFQFMVDELAALGYKIFVETPEFLTVRAKAPHSGEVADFVLARRDGEYSDGRRPDQVMPGTLIDDLARRDLTCNAIAMAQHSQMLIDPFNGARDIHNRILRAVGNPETRMMEDPLRVLRALRFALTLGFDIEGTLLEVIGSDEASFQISSRVAQERVAQEVGKMFASDSAAAVELMSKFPKLNRAVFSRDVWLQTSMKRR